MLAKSKRSAFIMASIASLTYFVTDFFFSLATHDAATGNFPSIQEELNNIQLSWSTVIIFIITLLILIGLGGLMINALFSSDIHFGVSGVIRWGLVGTLDAALMKLYPSLWTGISYTFALQKIIELAIVPISYVIAFKVFPFSGQEKEAGIS
jgi:hypothetical protein